jgi:hypothetical protein
MNPLFLDSVSIKHFHIVFFLSIPEEVPLSSQYFTHAASAGTEVSSADTVMSMNTLSVIAFCFEISFRPLLPVNKKESKQRNSLASVRERTIRPRNSLLSTKLVPTVADRGCRVVRTTDPYGRILGFLDRGKNRVVTIKYHLISSSYCSYPFRLLGTNNSDSWLQSLIFLLEVSKCCKVSIHIF